jgi:general secretion pathway protein I
VHEHAPVGARASTGFTLLEAIVALAILASLGATLFAWVNSNIMALSRVKDVNARSDAQVNIVEFMGGVNPMERPQGVADFGPYRINWAAARQTDPQDNAGYPAGAGLYQVALYATRIRVLRADETEWFEFTLRQVGFRKARQMTLPFQ